MVYTGNFGNLNFLLIHIVLINFNGFQPIVLAAQRVKTRWIILKVRFPKLQYIPYVLKKKTLNKPC
jgi:hypothetical protein